MMTAILFGIELAPLFAAIAEVESENGRTSGNVYQISSAYLNDANRIIADMFKECGGAIHPAYFYPNEVNSRSASELMMKVYWEYYGNRYIMMTKRLPTVEVLARIHNGGPDGWKKPSTLGYWGRVRAAMVAAERKANLKRMAFECIFGSAMVPAGRKAKP